MKGKSMGLNPPKYVQRYTWTPDDLKNAQDLLVWLNTGGGSQNSLGTIVESLGEISFKGSNEEIKGKAFQNESGEWVLFPFFPSASHGSTTR